MFNERDASPVREIRDRNNEDEDFALDSIAISPAEIPSAVGGNSSRSSGDIFSSEVTLSYSLCFLFCCIATQQPTVEDEARQAADNGAGKIEKGT